MYKLTCRDIGIDCDFVVENSEKKIICDSFNLHTTAKHNRVIPMRKILGTIEKKNKEQHNERKTNNIDESETLKLEKWSFGRRHFS